MNGIYPITDTILTPDNSIYQQVEEVLKNGIKIIQLRDKRENDKIITKHIHNIQTLCTKYGAKFILNDRVDLAIFLGVDGLHIGKSDYHRVKNIRKDFKGILGVSCYGDVKEAKKMENIGVDYVAFGSFYHSPTKPNANIVPLEVLKIAKESLNIPICAIGGINTTNINQIMAYSPDMVSVISDIWSGDLSKKIAIYKKYF